MNRLAALLIALSMVLVAAATGRSTMAQTEPTMTEEHIEHIRQNCSRVQVTLSQLRASDALLRVDRGRLYERISTKLMAPLNSRITMNRLDGLKLPATTLEYDRQRESFRNHYQQYEEALSRTLEIRCNNQPVTFYDSLRDTREKRLKVHADIVSLNASLQTYRTNVEEFAKVINKDDSQ